MAQTRQARTMPVAARAVHATKLYGAGATAVRALDGVSLDIPTQQFTAVMGPSGSGKSTLMHCLAGLDDLTSGHVYLGDIDLGTLNDRQLTGLRRERIGFVFQSFNLIPTMNAAENIALPLVLANKKPNPDWVDEIVDAVGLAGLVSHRPGELSGGEQQRVAMTRALVTQPELIFADEPTGNLDSRSGAELLTFMRRCVTDLGQTIVMVTHDPSAAAYADGVVFLADGKVADRMDDPTADSVLDRIKSLAA